MAISFSRISSIPSFQTLSWAEPTLTWTRGRAGSRGSVQIVKDRQQTGCEPCGGLCNALGLGLLHTAFIAQVLGAVSIKRFPQAVDFLLELFETGR